jgi:hypothetical protein
MTGTAADAECEALQRKLIPLWRLIREMKEDADMLYAGAVAAHEERARTRSA